MVLPILCAGTLLAADYGLRSLARRGKLERALLGGRIRLELLETRTFNDEVVYERYLRIADS